MGTARENSNYDCPLTQSDIPRIVQQVVALLSVPGGSATNTLVIPDQQSNQLMAMTHSQQDQIVLSPPKPKEHMVMQADHPLRLPVQRIFVSSTYSL